ncbi:hypothetical protein ACU6VG_14715 [Sphaerotilus sulfidivorans]
MPRRCRSAWPRHTSAPDLEVLPLLAGPPLASAEPVEVECLPSGAGGRRRGAAGRPGHATPVRQTSRCCRRWPGCCWPVPSWSRSKVCRSVPRRCRSAWPRHTSAPYLEVLPPLAGLLLAGAELVEVEGVPAGAAALPVSLAAPHQCARPRGAAAAGRAAAGERRAGRGRVPAFWR